MTFKEEANTIYDEKGRALATVDVRRGKRFIKRTPACTIGEYFAILSWEMDNEQTSAE